MTLSEEARERLADVVALQPTKNAELQAEWGMDSGSEVHQYLESELKDYYYRDENSLVCATPAAEPLVGVETEGEGEDGARVVTVPALQAAACDVVSGPDEESQSVVSVLHDLQESRTDTGGNPDVDAVRTALRSLSERGVLERVEKTVPTYRLAVPRDDLDVRATDGSGTAADSAPTDPA